MTLKNSKLTLLCSIASLSLLLCQSANAQQEPVLLAAVTEGFDAEQSYKQSCAACHDTGAAHAPELGDVIEWEIRLEKGLDTINQNVINGLNGMMPPRGLCTNCSDDDLKALVQYMLAKSK